MEQLVTVLERIADALERLSPPPPPAALLETHDAFAWSGSPPRLAPIACVEALPLEALRGIDRQIALVLDNTRRFAGGGGGNNVLLWGARGTGKSSLVKSVFRAVNDDGPRTLALVEIARDELATLPRLLDRLQAGRRRTIVFCDDLSFDPGEAGYKALKSVLEGGLAGRPANVLFYATSNRRHLMAREMIDNERGSAIHPSDAVEEKVSLSDRFGLSIGFYGCDQDTYLEMVSIHAGAAGISLPLETLRTRALEWATTRGARSGRVATQFVASLAHGTSGSNGRI